ncbi:MAG: glycosyltransferase [Polyangiaceae bacterium]
MFWKPLRTVYEWWIYLWVTPTEANGPAKTDNALDGRTVDVFTTAMPGEPRDMILRTLGAIARMTRVTERFLLDGGNDPALRLACTSLGVTHVPCTDIPGAKAGKVNHCLRSHSRSEFVLVIDPDHVPQPDFIERVLPWFSDTFGRFRAGRAGLLQPPKELGGLGSGRTNLLFLRPHLDGASRIGPSYGNWRQLYVSPRSPGCHRWSRRTPGGRCVDEHAHPCRWLSKHLSALARLDWARS